MKNFILVISFILLGFLSSAQEEGDVFASLKYGQKFQSDGFYNLYGVEFNYYFTDNWSVRYSFDVMHNNVTNRTGFHGPIGPIVALPVMWVAIRLSDWEGELIAGAFIAGLMTTILPEGIEYKVNLSKNLKLSPFANLAGVDYIDVDGFDRRKLRYAPGFGTKFSFGTKENKWKFNLIGSYKYTFSQGLGSFYGASIAYNLKNL